MHSPTVKDKGETRVCAPVQSREELMRCESPANKREKMCAQGNFRNALTVCVMDKGETSVCTSSKQRRVDAV